MTITFDINPPSPTPNSNDNHTIDISPLRLFAFLMKKKIKEKQHLRRTNSSLCEVKEERRTEWMDERMEGSTRNVSANVTQASRQWEDNRRRKDLADTKAEA